MIWVVIKMILKLYKDLVEICLATEHCRPGHTPIFLLKHFMDGKQFET